MLRECEQQIEFAAREQHQRVVGGAQFPPGDIETPAAETTHEEDLLSAIGKLLANDDDESREKIKKIMAILVPAKPTSEEEDEGGEILPKGGRLK